MDDNPNALRPGTVIGGFHVVRVLGDGGFGITYEAQSPVTGRRVAIKEFFPRGIASRGDVTRLVYSSRDNEMVRWALDRFEQTEIGMRAVDDIDAARAAAAGAAIRVGLLAQQRLRKMQRQNALPDAAASGDQQRVRPARTRLQRGRSGFALPWRQRLPFWYSGFVRFDHFTVS